MIGNQRQRNAPVPQRVLQWARRAHAGAHRRLSPAAARELDQFTLLSRDSVRSLLNAAAASREDDPLQFALWAGVLMALPPAMYAFRELLNYSAMRFAPFGVVDLSIQSDRMFFVLYGMLAAAFLAAMTWDALLPDRTDQEVIGTLPVRPRTLAAARLAAAVIVATSLSTMISIPAAIMLAVAGPSHPALGFLPTVFFAHVVATMAASLFAFLALVILRGTLAFCLGAHASERLATVVQLVTVAGLAEVFFFLPGVLPAFVSRMIAGDATVMALPPVWFAALYSWLVGSPHTAIAAPAAVAPLALAVAVGLALPAYLLPASVLARRAVETQRHQHAGLISSLARTAAIVLPVSAAVRGIVVFIVASLLRSRRHRMIVTVYAGIAIAIGTMSLFAGGIRGTIVSSHPGVSMLSLPLVLLFFVVLGTRTAFGIPTDVEANWSFRTARPTVTAAIDATAIAILLVGAFPIIVIVAAGALVLGWGPRLAAAVAAIDLLSAIAMVEWALSDWRKIPFTCGYLTDAESIKSRWLSRIVPLILFAFVNAALQRNALRSIRGLLWYAGAAAVIIAALHVRRRLTARRSTLQFDASASDEMATLNLAET